MHDLDVSGFTSNRRYRFTNDVPVVDIGLRLADIEKMGLESEPTDVSGNWRKREQTLLRHGATPEEIAFLEESRVELNAMTSRQLLDFVEEKLYSMISTCRVSRYWARATGDGAGIGTDRCVSQLVEVRTGLEAPRGDVGGNCFPRGSLRRSVGVAKVHLFQALAPSQPEMPPTTKMD